MWERVGVHVLQRVEVYAELRRWRALNPQCFGTFDSLKEAFAAVDPRLLYKLTRRLPNSGRYYAVLREWITALTDPRILVGKCACARCTGQRGVFLLHPEKLVQGKNVLKDLLVGHIAGGLDSFNTRAHRPELKCFREDCRMVGLLSLVNTANTKEKNHVSLCKATITNCRLLRVGIKAIASKTLLEPCELLLSYGKKSSFTRTHVNSSLSHQLRLV